LRNIWLQNCLGAFDIHFHSSEEGKREKDDCFFQMKNDGIDYLIQKIIEETKNLNNEGGDQHHIVLIDEFATSKNIELSFEELLQMEKINNVNFIIAFAAVQLNRKNNLRPSDITEFSQKTSLKQHYQFLEWI